MTDPNRQVLGELQLNDGRTLAYAQCGDLDGKPVFFFQGAPSTRFFRPEGALAAQMGTRLITVDRPGFGASTFSPGRRVLDWPDDVVALTEHLGIDRFAVTRLCAAGRARMNVVYC